MPTSSTSSTPRSSSTASATAELARAAVDQHEIGPFGLCFVGFAFLHEPRETARQHFAHHAVIVAGRELRRFDVELAILAFLETVRPRHDHAAQRVRALDVRIVIDLDAFGRRFEAEGFGNTFQQFALRAVLGLPAAQLLARVLQRHVDDLALLAPLRHGDFDLAFRTRATAHPRAVRLRESLPTDRTNAGAVRSS